jgi:hypothetical protein
MTSDNVVHITPEMLEEPNFSEELAGFRKQFYETTRRILKMFCRVRPGAPWWYWFRRGEDVFILKVVQDGSGHLWTDEGRGGLYLFEWMVREKIQVLGPVRALELEVEDD